MKMRQLFRKTNPTEGSHMLTNIVVISYWPLCVLIALLTPHNIFDHSWARSFADFTARFIPLVAEAGKNSPLPELYFAAAAINMTAVVFSILALFLSLTLDREFHVRAFSASSKKEKRFSLLIATPLWSLLLFWGVLSKPFAEYPAACRGDECMPYPGGYKGEGSVPLIRIGPCVTI